MPKVLHECDECTFVPDIEFIARTLPSDVMGKISKEPVFIGSFTMPDWTGHSKFYVFRCAACKEIVVDYPHGYTSHGYLFLCCYGCAKGKETISGKNTILSMKKKWFYDFEGIDFPNKEEIESLKEEARQNGIVIADGWAEFADFIKDRPGSNTFKKKNVPLWIPVSALIASVLGLLWMFKIPPFR